MKKIKILLIGKNGQIGSSIKKRLSKVNKNITCWSKKELNLENLLSIQKKLNKIKPEIIINAAAYTKVDDAEKNKNLCYKVNSLSTKKIAEWAYKNNSFLVYYSTDYVFSSKNNQPYKENDKTKPINVYGKSKLAGEKNIISSKCKYLILRISWIYADNGENFPKKIIKKIRNENEISVVNDQIGTPNHADFISEITLKIIQKIIKKPYTNPKVLNLSARGSTSYYNLAKKIYEKLKKKYKNCKITPIYTNELITKIKRPLNSKLNVSKLEKFLNTKLPDWELIFNKKINKIIKNYDN